MSKFMVKCFYVDLEDKVITTEGFLTKSQKTLKNAGRADYQSFVEQLQAMYTEFDKDGYDVINVIPIQGGSSHSCLDRGGCYHGDACFSITRGAMVVGKLRN